MLFLCITGRNNNSVEDDCDRIEKEQTEARRLAKGLSLYFRTNPKFREKSMTGRAEISGGL